MRIRPVEEDRAPWWARWLLFRSHRKKFGKVLTPATVYAHTPPILAGFNIMQAMIQRSGRISTMVRALVNVRIAQINGCHF